MCSRRLPPSRQEPGTCSGGTRYAGMVPRGRVELPTPAFSGPRSTGELPRHRNSKQFYGKGNSRKREKPKGENPKRGAEVLQRLSLHFRSIAPQADCCHSTEQAGNSWVKD